jgi:hypothetical protein
LSETSPPQSTFYSSIIASITSHHPPSLDIIMSSDHSSGLAKAIHDLTESDTFDLSGQTQATITADIIQAFQDPLTLDTMICITLITGTEKLGTQKYDDNATKSVTNALEKLGYEENHQASCISECAGSFKVHQDTGKNIKTVVVFPRIVHQQHVGSSGIYSFNNRRSVGGEKADETPSKLPSVPLPDSKKTSDLMSRLNSFLPQMQAANKILNNVNKANLQVDLDLESDNDDNYSDDDEKPVVSSLINEISSDKGKEDNENNVDVDGKQTAMPHSINHEPIHATPTIQLQFALGEMTGNPIMKLLGNDADNDADNIDDESDKEQDDNIEASARQDAVTKLLSGNSAKGSNKAEIALLKPPLITEL